MAKGRTDMPAGPGRPKGSSNKSTIEFKEAVTNLLNHAAPQMVKWLDMVAAEDPNKALDHVGKLAEFVQAKLSRSDSTVEHKGGITIEVVQFGQNKITGQ